MPEPEYRVQLAAARSALEDGRLLDAEQGFARLQRDFPDQVAGIEGLAQIAMVACDWNLAWERWSQCLQSRAFPRLGWLQGRAWAAFHLRRYASAQEEFANAARHFPQHHGGFSGQALVLTRLEAWEAARAAWRRLFLRFPEARTARHLAAYAQCLEHLGKLEMAVAILDEVVPGEPEYAEMLHQKSGLWLRAGRTLEALAVNAEAMQLLPDDFSVTLQRLAILHALRRPAEARQALGAALALATQPSELESIFEFVPAIFEGWPRTAAWLAIQERLAAMLTAATAPASGNSASLGPRLRLALRDREGFAAGVNAMHHAEPGPMPMRLKRTAALLGEPAFPDFLAPKVFGIGLSKTGTTSLVHALEALGYHAAHYINDLTREILKIDDALMFDAMADTPVCVMFESLYHLFPNAKFIYTVRPLASWSKSVLRHFDKYQGISEFRRSRAGLTKPDRAPEGLEVALLHGALYYHHDDAPAAYAAYDARVRNFFASHDPRRLLVFDVETGDGWEKLCAFLGKDVPDGPFPWANKASA